MKRPARRIGPGARMFEGIFAASAAVVPGHMTRAMELKERQ